MNSIAIGCTSGKAKGGPMADTKEACVPSFGLSADACLACDLVHSEGKESEPKTTKTDCKCNNAAASWCVAAESEPSVECE